MPQAKNCTLIAARDPAQCVAECGDEERWRGFPRPASRRHTSLATALWQSAGLRDANVFIERQDAVEETIRDLTLPDGRLL